MLICPKCQKPLYFTDKAFQCENKHNYDMARQGYVNLLLGSQKMSGDSKEMVHARTHFLEQGFYEPLQNKLCELLERYAHACCVDLGCGEGYYTRAVAKLCEQCYGVDMSKEALKYASVHDKKTQYVLASIFHCPLASESFDAALNIFAPLPESEILRLLKDKGVLIRVIPAERHLYEFKQRLYEQVYENEVDRIDNKQLKLMEEVRIEKSIHLLDAQTIYSLFQMTPYYWKTPKAAAEKLKSLSELETTIAFVIQIYEKNA